VIILIVFVVVACIDQITKAIILTQVPEDTGLYSPQHPKFFQITHQRNPGLVGGMFRERPTLRSVAPVLACLVLLYLFRHLDATSKLQSLAYGLIAGGALGNLIDRVRLGSVTDFLQFHFYFIPFNFPWKQFPSFNIADSAICTGVFFLIVSWWAAPPMEQSANEPAKEPAKNRKA